MVYVHRSPRASTSTKNIFSLNIDKTVKIEALPAAETAVAGGIHKSDRSHVVL